LTIVAPLLLSPDMEGLELSFELDAGKVARRLSLVVLALVASHITAQVLVTCCSVPRGNRGVTLFDLNQENNFPSLYSGAALLLASGFLAVTAAAERRRNRPAAAWNVLSAVFVLLAADEWLSLHERVGSHMKRLVEASGAFHHPWVIPVGLLTAALGLLYIPFLLRLPRRTRILFVVSGLIFVGAAAGLEMVGGLIIDRWGGESLAHAVEVLVEESMEMFGVVFFIYSIISYIQTEFPGYTLRLVFSRPRAR
jgi:hypothetical protein